MNVIAPAYLLIITMMSVVSFAAFGIDKRRSIRRERRISERSLHLLTLLGGWPGAWMGSRFFRHKTQKFSFRVVFWIIVMFHVVLIAGATSRLI